MKSAFKKLSVNKHSIDAGLIFAVTILAAISTLLIYSISESGISDIEGVGASYWRTQLFSMIAGIGVATLISLIDYRKLVKLWFVFVPVALVLVALTFTSLGYQRAGADDKAWLNLGFIQFQPSEILKLAFILTFSYHLSRDEEDMNKPLHMLLLAIHGLLPIGIVGLQGDYGTAIVFGAIFAFMICSAKISWKYVDYQSSEKKNIKENQTDTIVSKEMPEEDQWALAATLTDLHMGFLAIGGETSVGRGLFRITNVDGEDKINGKEISELIQTGAGDPDKEEDICNFIYDKIHSLAHIEEHK